MQLGNDAVIAVNYTFILCLVYVWINLYHMQDLTKGVMSASAFAELMLMTAINYQMDRPPWILNT